VRTLRPLLRFLRLLPRYDLVVARYQEDPAWTRRFRSVFLYNKGPSLPGGVHSIPLPNVGREAHTYLHHIISNYHNLAPITAFFQGTKPEFGYRGVAGGGHLCSSVTVDDYLLKPRFVYTASVTVDEQYHRHRTSYVQEVTLKRPVPALPRGGSRDKWSPFAPYIWSINDFARMKHTQLTSRHLFRYIDFCRNILQIDISQVSHVNYAQGAQFSVNRSSIQRYPLSFYYNLLSYLDKHICPYEAVFMEWSWGLLFDDRKTVLS